jgi:hypothetical protein
MLHIATNFIFNYFFLQNSSLTCDQCNILGSLWNLADPGNKICQLVILNNGMIYLTWSVCRYSANRKKLRSDRIQLPEKYKEHFNISSKGPSSIPWIPEPSTVNNKLKRREGSGSTGTFFD